MEQILAGFLHKTQIYKICRLKAILEKELDMDLLQKNGYKLASFDYSQIELRVAAMLSGDKMTQNIL